MSSTSPMRDGDAGEDRSAGNPSDERPRRLHSVAQRQIGDAVADILDRFDQRRLQHECRDDADDRSEQRADEAEQARTASIAAATT